MDGYQPPLLSLQDMLNLSDEEGNDTDNWSNNPFNIANFFEPISQAETGVGDAGTSTSAIGVGGYQSAFIYGHDSASQQHPGNDMPPSFSNAFETVPLVDIKREHCSTGTADYAGFLKSEFSNDGGGNNQNDDEDMEGEFPDLDCFDEAVVTCELESEQEGSEVSGPISVQNVKVESILPDFAADDSVPVSSPRKSYKRPAQVSPRKEVPFKEIPSKGPSLKEVKLEDVKAADIKEQLKGEREGKCRHEAINQLNSLISALKRYCTQLENFLHHEGDMILEHYNAKTLLRGILPEINESATANQMHPFYEAHAVTKAIINHYKGRTSASTLPPREAHLWRSSELLLLQKTILESVIHQREFLLYCRYTDLLTQMGFDDEDMERLSRSLTKEAEVGLMKIIVNEHNFHSKLKGSQKKAIQTTIVSKDHNGSGIPRVFVYPAPEKLVEDKWNALMEIRRRTVLSNIEDEDISWLFVLKRLTDKNPKLKWVDETTCKLTYDHLLSFKYRNSPWHVSEVLKLKEIREKHPNMPWTQLAVVLGTNRSAFSCFVKYKAHCSSDTGNCALSTDHMNLVRKCFDKCAGNAFKVDFMLSRVLRKYHSWVRPSRLIVIAQKSLDPRLKKGKFSMVEDALLLVVMEKYKDFVLETGTGTTKCPLGYAMPWRYSSVWKSRLKILFTKFFRKMWTLEEDKHLWRLVEEYGANYKIIERAFPHRDRKQCRNRYMHLAQILQTTSLEDYHLIYSYRKRGLDLDRMEEIVEYLKMTVHSKLSGNVRYVQTVDLEFLKLRIKPTDYNLESYLMTFPVGLMRVVYERLIACIDQINAKYTNSGRTIEVDFLKGFDRRKFDAQCPYSVGSALHLRDAKLVSQESLDDLTEFETKVYTAHKFFSLKSKTKKGTQRTGIPSLDKLQKITSISRIIQPSAPTSHHRPGEPFPSVIMSIKSEILDDAEKERQEQELLQELEEQKKGGARKGGKRKGTRTKENRKRAAMIRWQNQRAANQGIFDIEQGGDGLTDATSDVADSPFWEAYSPCTPATPGSVASASTAISTDNESVTGSGPSMRKVLMGLLSDHAYIHPMENPGDMSNLSLPQLFAKMGRAGRGKPTGSS